MEKSSSSSSIPSTAATPTSISRRTFSFSSSSSSPIFSTFLLSFLFFFNFLARTSFATTTPPQLTPILSNNAIHYKSDFEIYYDPPSGTVSPTSLGVFVWSNYDSHNAKVFYEIGSGSAPIISPTLNSSHTTTEHPYIQIDTGFKIPRNRTLTLVGYYIDSITGLAYRSQQVTVVYYIEGSARPYSYGYLIPGVESGGYFLQVELEVAASARAQSAGSQEFADFFSKQGYGTYRNQTKKLDLKSIDKDLNGFEGGFSYNLTKHGPYYGILIPYYNGNDFYGKVVRVNLWGMEHPERCAASWVLETKIANGVHYTGPASINIEDACVHILDLQSLHPNARGFRRGFLGYPYGYLSPGKDQIAVRLNLTHFGLSTTRIIDLNAIDSTYGGYSGGFADNLWACYTPYLTFNGELGGIRSAMPADRNTLKPYYSSIMICIHDHAWNEQDVTIQRSYFRDIDFSALEIDLRGFSDSIRVGRYAYLTPLTSGENIYSSKMIRIDLGPTDIGTSIETAKENGDIRQILDVLDLSIKDPNLAGYSGLFTSGQYLFLVPFRNKFIASNGQRGHGFVVRLNMNHFNLEGIDFLDIASTTRNQIPSFLDTNLRGYSYGFASGKYCVLVPFFNGDFSGKMARFYNLQDLSADLQELDLRVDRDHPNVFKGYRGGFVSLWNGVDNPHPIT